MDNKGNIILIILAAILGIMLLPPLVMAIWPPAKLLFQIMMIFMIYSIVRGYLGAGPLTIIISGILIWIMVFKYTAILASLWAFQMLLGVQFFSIIIWGVGTQLRKH